MYYLLEDNRIVDSKDFEELVIKNNDIKKAKKIIKKNNVEKYCYCIYQSKIKKKSENVYDLIEIGDLVKYKRDDEFYIEEALDIFVTDTVIETPTEYVHEEDFLAIYKPDAKGNYIKVWEKKDE